MARFSSLRHGRSGFWNRVDEFDEGTITIDQYFMNKTVIKYNNIVCVSDQFQGSIATVQEDIVAMLDQKQKDRKCKTEDDETPIEKG